MEYLVKKGSIYENYPDSWRFEVIVEPDNLQEKFTKTDLKTIREAVDKTFCNLGRISFSEDDYDKIASPKFSFSVYISDTADLSLTLKINHLLISDYCWYLRKLTTKPYVRFCLVKEGSSTRVHFHDNVDNTEQHLEEYSE